VTLTLNWLKISSFNMHTSLQMCVPVVNCQKSCLSFSRTALFHNEPAWLSGFWSRKHQSIPQHQTASTSDWWHKIPVALSIACLPLPVVCSNCEKLTPQFLRRTVHWQLAKLTFYEFATAVSFDLRRTFNFKQEVDILIVGENEL